MHDGLTIEEAAAIRRLRDRGCAVTVFLPCEVQHGNPRKTEEKMRAAGWQQIDADSLAILARRGYSIIARGEG